jgi:hypothetical protein
MLGLAPEENWWFTCRSHVLGLRSDKGYGRENRSEQLAGPNELRRPGPGQLGLRPGEHRRAAQCWSLCSVPAGIRLPETTKKALTETVYCNPATAPNSSKALRTSQLLPL